MKFRGAIIGFGFIASRGHLPAWRQLAEETGDLEISAVVDPCVARAAAAQQILPGVRVFESLDELLRAGAIDFVDICTPPALHYGQARAALERGLHVLCEKPLTTLPGHALELAELARAQGRVLAPAHNYLFAPSIAEATRLIDSGELGRPRLLSLQVFRTQHAKGTPEWNPDWRRLDCWSGGGIAMDHGSHALYLASRWLGSKARSIRAHLEFGDPKFPANEDLVQATADFDGATACLHLTWRASVRKVIYAFHGEQGAFVMDDDRIEVTRRGEPPETRLLPSHWHDAGHDQWFVPLFRKFRLQMKTRIQNNPDLEDAIRCVELISDVYRTEHLRR